MEQTAQRNRAEWFFSEDGHRAYASSGTTGEKTRYFFEYLRGLGQKTPDRVLYKLAYIMADSMDAAGGRFAGWPAILQGSVNPFIKLVVDGTLQPAEEMERSLSTGWGFSRGVTKQEEDGCRWWITDQLLCALHGITPCRRVAYEELQDSSAETDTAFLEECENFDAKYRENAADVRMLRQTAKEQYDAEVRPVQNEIARFEADEQAWRTAAETEMESFDLLPENYRYLAGEIAAIVRRRRAHSLTDALNLAIREEKEEEYRESQMDAMAARNAILREQARSEELHQKQMQELERQRIENERAANERLLAAQREQDRAADRRLEQEQARQRREDEKARIEADKSRQAEDARRRRREYAANQIKLARNQQSKDYWESEWKRNL